MKIPYLLSVLSIVVIMSSCGGSKYATKAVEGDTEMMLKKGVCFGKCPVYTLEIKKGGIAMLDAKNNMDGMLGKYQKKLSKDQYNELLRAFGESEFVNFPAYYDSQIPDLPMVTIGYVAEDTLQITKGKEERPSSLMQLQFRLENIAKAQDWDLIEAYDRPVREAQEEEPKYILSEIIILPKPGISLPRWFRSYEEYGVRVLKKIAPNQNYWLITYDEGKIKPEEVLQMIKADEKILEAEFNKETTERAEDGGR